VKGYFCGNDLATGMVTRSIMELVIFKIIA